MISQASIRYNTAHSFGFMSAYSNKVRSYTLRNGGAHQFLCDSTLCSNTDRTYPWLHHVCFPVELEEGRILIQFGFPLSCSFLQIWHLALQALHLSSYVLHMVIVLHIRKKTTATLKVFQGIQQVGDRARILAKRLDSQCTTGTWNSSEIG